MTDADKLRVYDKLREAHKFVKAIYGMNLPVEPDSREALVVQAVDTVIYMAESEFARMSD